MKPFILLAFCLVLLCNRALSATPVVASNSLVGDIVRQIGGERISLNVLATEGVDPHGFDPTPQDAMRLHNARVIFLNGVGLEAGLDRLIDAASAKKQVCIVSDGIDLLDAGGESCTHEGHDHDHVHGDTHDPHVWFDPLLVKTWATNIAARLTVVDPAGADHFSAARDRLTASLDELDIWIQTQVATLPKDRRIFATDHQVLGYFVRRYGFAPSISLNEGFSTMTQPDVRAISDVIKGIRSRGVRAVFVGMGVNTELAKQVAAETGIPVIRLHTGALGAKDSGATTYQEFMRSNVLAMVRALK